MFQVVAFLVVLILLMAACVTAVKYSERKRIQKRHEDDEHDWWLDPS